MNKDEFVRFVSKNIKFHLPDSFKSCQIGYDHNMKLIVAEKNAETHLRLDLSEQYETFMRDKNIFLVMETISSNIIEGWKISKNSEYEIEQAKEYVNNYDKAKKHLQIIVCDPDINPIPQNSVVTSVGEYVALYNINLDTNTDQNMSIRVTQTVLNQWGISKEQLHQDALAVEEKWNKPVLMNLFDLMNHMRFNFPKPPNLLSENAGGKLDEDEIYMLTNANSFEGAGMLAHSEVLEQISSLLSDNNYYILPSSKHELMIKPDNNSVSVNQLYEMVQLANTKDVPTEDLLSNKILYYNPKEKVLELASDKDKDSSQEVDNTKQEEIVKKAPKQSNGKAEFKPRL